MIEDTRRRLLAHFAALLEYPAPGLVEAARACEELLAEQVPAAFDLLQKFRALVETTPSPRLEEIYSGSFDLDPTWYPYVGYHLLGESYKRSIFLVKLKESYATEGFTFGTELPDHLSVVLRFLATTRDDALASELTREALLPTLERMTGKKKSAGYDEESQDSQPDRWKAHPYGWVLEALRLALRELTNSDPKREVPGQIPAADQPSRVGGEGG